MYNDSSFLFQIVPEHFNPKKPGPSIKRQLNGAIFVEHFRGIETGFVYVRYIQGI